MKRKKYFVVYVKEGAQIVDLLNIMEAHLALMDRTAPCQLQRPRYAVRPILPVQDSRKRTLFNCIFRNSVNRQVNCEAANINKTVQAAAKQIGDILYIRVACHLHQKRDRSCLKPLRQTNPDFFRNHTSSSFFSFKPSAILPSRGADC